MKAAAADYRRSRTPPRKVTFQTQEPEVPKEEAAKDGNQNTEPKVCGACLILTDVVNYSQATTSEREMVKTSVGSPLKVSSVSSLSEMSTVQGLVGEKTVEVLRDTGCSGVIVSKDLVPESAYTGKSQTMVMVDYSSKSVPEVKVSIDTPYYKGEVLALCVEKPLVRLIIGNIPGARERNNPDINWVPALTVQTRAQAKREGVTNKLKTPSIIDRTTTPAQVSNAQKDDISLTTTRSRCEANETIRKATFLKKNDLLYRKFCSPNVEHGRIFTQFIVPQQYRTLVMKLAHESVIAGHLAIKRTMQKVLSEFYWPGINSDIKRFCQSCDICQRTTPKGKIVKAPLGKMPRIDVPFRRIATDLIGPLKPVTYNKYRYILTLVDYATRYPEAVPLASIDTETVAEALVSIFRRVGIPNEALMERQPTEDGRKTVCMNERKVSFCNISDECKTSLDDFDRKDVLVWIFSFMPMMVRMMASCIGQWTCTLGEIFRKGTECCSKRIRGWLLTGCFIEWCGISIVLLYMTDGLPNFKFSETVMEIMWTYVVMRDVVEGVSMISEVPNWWLRPGKQKFTLNINGSIANHGKVIWRYVLKRSAERSKVSLREF